MLKQRIIRIAKGFCIGMADIVPGVSGGTMAFILGIYREFIAAIKSFDLAALTALLRLDFREALARPHFGFIVPLIIGIAAALLFFTRVVPLPQLLLDYPEQVYGLFFGLIGGSILVLLRETDAMTGRDYITLALGAAGGYMVFNLVPVQTPDAGWFIFVAGALAICAMMLPGISGSFVLLILNKYAYVFNAIGYLNLSVLLPFAGGVLAGLVFFSRLLSWILERWYRATVVFITGLLLASLTVIWPFQERIYETVGGDPLLVETHPVFPSGLSVPVLLSFTFIIAGVSIVLMINHFHKPQPDRG
jgi:putative membrane protein